MRLRLLCSAILGLSFACPAGAQPVLRVADQKGLQRALLEAAHALDGVPYRIEWSEFEAASPLLQALAAGAVDTGIAGDAPFLFGYGAGLPIRATFAIRPRDGGRTVAVVTARNSAIHRAADLRGRRIATVRGSVGHFLLLRLAERGDFPLAAVRIVFLSPAQSKAALEAGSVDAWSAWEPYISLEQAQTGARVWSTQTGLPLALSEKVAGEMRTAVVPLTDGLVSQEQATLGTYREAGALPAWRPVSAAFDRSFGPLH